MTFKSKPNVLVLGGIDLFATVLAQQLVPPSPAEPLVAHLRIVDRYSICPPTTYMSKSFLNSLQFQNDLIEYRRGNLSNPDTISRAFTDPAPNGRPYTYIIDATGELLPDRPVAFHVFNTFDVALNIAQFAASQLSQSPGSIKAYIRIIPPFHEHTDKNRRYKEEDADGWRPKDLQCAWYQEMMRAVGSIEGLPLIMLRPGLIYGEGECRLEIIASILLGLVYQHLGQTMDLLWSPELPKNSINVQDFAMVVWKTAEWISTKSRAEVDALAGVPIPPTNDVSVTPINAPKSLSPLFGSVIVPVFNVVDDSDTTQQSLSETIGSVYGINVGFQGPLESSLAGMQIGKITEKDNGVHVHAWNEIIKTSNPPVPSTPLTPYLPMHSMKEHGCALNGEKIKKTLGIKYKYPQLDQSAVLDYIGWCREEGIWPETKIYTKL